MIISGKVQFDIYASWDYMPVYDPNADPVEPVPDPNGEIVPIETQAKAQKALKKVDAAMIQKDRERANLGALQNRLENTVTNLTIQCENLQTAESRITDTEVAREMTIFVRYQVLAQSAVAMLGQANPSPRLLSALING